MSPTDGSLPAGPLVSVDWPAETRHDLVRTVPPAEATGALKDAYDWQAARLGFPSDFTQLGSLAPDLVHARLALYRATENVESSLTDRQKNLIAHTVSSLNATPHCASQTRVKLRELGVDDNERAAVERGDYDILDTADAAVLRYTAKLTMHPASITVADIAALRDAGFDDVDIVHINAQAAHLNYVSRVANGLGLLHEIDAETYDPSPPSRPDRAPGSG